MSAERSVPKSKSSKALFADALSELANKGPQYVQVEVVALLVKEKGISITPGSVEQYLAEAVSGKKIFDAGRGWYSTLSTPFTLDTKPISRIIKQLSAAFPLAAFSCWSTAQINAYTQHLLNRFVTFVYVEPDLIAPFAESLRESGYRVYADPGKAEVEKRFIIEKDTVVIRKAISKQPEGENHATPIEKLLVDLVWESKKLPVIDVSEAQMICNNTVAAGRVNMAELLGYAKRRYLDFSWLKVLSNSTFSKKVELLNTFGKNV